VLCGASRLNSDDEAWHFGDNILTNRSGTNVDQLTLCIAPSIIDVRFHGRTRMTLKARAQEKVERAGISNYSFDHDILVMCGVRYTIEACNCGEPECDGVRLRKNATAIGRVLQ